MGTYRLILTMSRKRINLNEISTLAPKGDSKKDYLKKREAATKELADLQHLLYAEEKYSLLVIFQGMDASGKDGTTRKVFRYCSPSGVWAYPFKKPSEEEFDHDFLWRVHKVVPRKGQIQIFNRSHYEDVLIQRVHNWITEKQVDQRFNAINAFEKLLINDNNTTILKFYMHLSQDRQKEKLQERIDNPRKQWKHNPNDWKEAELWDEYRFCYEEVLNRSDIPWIIVPADQKWYRDWFVASHVVKVLKSLDMKLPQLKADKDR